MEEIELRSIIDNNAKKGKFGYKTLEECSIILRKKNSYLLDVRPTENTEGMTAKDLPGDSFYYIPYEQFDSFFKIKNINKESIIVIGCNKGLFSSRLAGYLEAMGYYNVYILNTDIVKLLDILYQNL